MQCFLRRYLHKMEGIKVGVLGGSFDPPHNGHIEIAKEALRVVDEVWVVPCGVRYDKHTMSDPYLRYAMTEEAFKGIHDRIRVDDVDVKQGEMMPTYILMSYLARIHPDKDLWFIVGSDLLNTWSGSWAYFEELITYVKFLVFKRPGYEVPEEYRVKPNFWIPEDLYLTPIDASSTRIRKAIDSLKFPASQESIYETLVSTDCLKPEVVRMIISHKLYGIDKLVKDN